MVDESIGSIVLEGLLSYRVCLVLFFKTPLAIYINNNDNNNNNNNNNNTKHSLINFEFLA